MEPLGLECKRERRLRRGVDHQGVFGELVDLSFAGDAHVEADYRANFNYRNLEQERTDDTLIRDIRRDFGINANVTYALAEHWSVGFNSMARRKEATRRSLTAYYEIGPVYRDYFEVTRDGKLEETRGEHALTLSLSQRQTWGNASIRLRGSNYLHDFDRHNISLNGNLSFRITRGLDVNFGASYSKVNDQLYLSGEGLTDEERFLRLRQEATDYEASIRFGISYTFGSIYNNVVNNRFGRGGGGGGRNFFQGFQGPPRGCPQVDPQPRRADRD